MTIKNIDLKQILDEMDEVHASSGLAHNQNVNELQKLNIRANIALVKTIIGLDKQNKKLEKRNMLLQKQMLVLTYVAGVLAILTFVVEMLIPIIKFLFKL